MCKFPEVQQHGATHTLEDYKYVRGVESNKRAVWGEELASIEMTPHCYVVFFLKVFTFREGKGGRKGEKH